MPRLENHEKDWDESVQLRHVTFSWLGIEVIYLPPTHISLRATLFHLFSKQVDPVTFPARRLRFTARVAVLTDSDQNPAQPLPSATTPPKVNQTASRSYIPSNITVALLNITDSAHDTFCSTLTFSPNPLSPRPQPPPPQPVTHHLQHRPRSPRHCAFCKKPRRATVPSEKSSPVAQLISRIMLVRRGPASSVQAAGFNAPDRS